MTASGNKFKSLSLEQRIAADSFGRQVCVAAGAGSGKTRVLVERYAQALTFEGTSTENILAMTFTDKAANEMKERLTAKLESDGRYEELWQIENAWIGTIHSFCARVLRENPVECGVDPNFSVLNRAEAQILMNKTLEQIFESESGNDLWAQWLADHGVEEVREIFFKAYDLFRGSAGDERVFLIEEKDSYRDNARENILTTVNQMREAYSGEVTSKAQAKFLALLEGICSNFTSAWPDAWAQLTALNDLTGTGKIERRGEDLKKDIEAIEALLEDYKSLAVQKLTAPFKNEFFRIFYLWKKSYESEKRRLSACDFEDLLYLVYKTFSSCDFIKKSILDRYRKQFHHIFVDEFQDTSHLQALILDLLKKPDNLFFVGDIQQSIYRFRQADPSVFKMMRAVSETRVLCENYRSRPEILEFLNLYFEPVFGGEFLKLKPARSFKQKKSHCLEIICVDQAEKNLDQARILEAKTIAFRIKEMIDQGFQIEDSSTGSLRPIRYGDIAILMRKTTASRFYQKELEDLRIPYYLQKGRGFYEQHEVLDLLNFLRLLDDASSENDVASAAVLRSPIVQLSDEALFWIADFRKRGSLGAFFLAVLNFERIPDLLDADKEKLRCFKELYERLKKAKDGLKISDILELLVRETAYDAKILTSKEGPQALANILKLINLARDMEGEAGLGIRDFIDWIKRLSDQELGESEARLLGEKEDVVRFLTVHSAKGLEFPCLILADMGAKKRNEDKPCFLMTHLLGLGARIKNPRDFDYYEDQTYREIYDKAESENLEEVNRLLYVALTRAQQHLILSGSTKASKTDSWMGQVLDFLGLSPDNSNSELIERKGLFFYLIHTKDFLESTSTVEKKLVKKIPESLSDLEIAAGSELLQNLLPVKKPYENLKDLSVSAIVSLASKKENYAQYEISDEQSRIIGDDEPLLPRNEYGTIFHRLMELSARYGLRGSLPADLYNHILLPLSDSDKAEMRQSFISFWSSPTGMIVKASEKCYPELPFIYKTRHGLLKGQMDLVFFTQDKEWIILDYKTNRFESGAGKELAVNQYKWQMGLYALAFWKLYGRRPSKTLLYFSTLNDCVEIGWTQNELEVLSEELQALFCLAVSQ